MKYLIIKVSEDDYKLLKEEKRKLHVTWFNLFVQQKIIELKDRRLKDVFSN